MLVYDCEIIRAIPGKDERIEGIEYCNGWRDFPNMGISLIGAYDMLEQRYRVFMPDNFHEFQKLIDKHDVLIGFNNLVFDNPLLLEQGFIFSDHGKFYDLLVEIWKSAELPPVYRHPTHAGFSLDACAYANFKLRKTGTGAQAPIDWQKGRHGTVIDYCLEDVRLTTRLIIRLIEMGNLIDPRDGTSILTPDYSRLFFKKKR